MKLDKVKLLIEEYQLKFRNPNLSEFEISPIYDLFPTEDISKDFQKWADTYYHNGKCGVYLILNDKFEVIYVGESLNIGKRLGYYFGYREDKSCLIKHNFWSENPRYVCSIAVENNTWFERLGLEEYLIYKIQPIDNDKGKSI